MHSIEFNGRTFTYRNAGQLDRLLHKRLALLRAQDKFHSDRQRQVRGEFKAIAKYLGIGLNSVEENSGSVPSTAERDVAVTGVLVRR